MSGFILIKKSKEQTKVHHSEYIRTGNTPDETGVAPTSPAKPAVRH
jgi:hypothetical protein